MKKIIAAIVVCFSLMMSAQAQTSKKSMGGKQGMETRQMLKDSLHLTDVQADSVTSIRQEFMGKIKTVMQNSSLSQEQKKEQVKPLREEMKLRLKNNLTEEQMRKLQGMRKGKMNDNQ